MRCSARIVLLGLAMAMAMAAVPRAQASGASPLPDETSFLEETFRQIRAWEADPLHPSYRELRVTTDFDSKDRPASKKEEVYRVTWYRERPLYVQERSGDYVQSPESIARMEEGAKRQIDEDIARPSDKEKIEAISLTPLIHRYTFKIEGREELWGRKAIKIRVEPVAEMFPEKKIAIRILEKMSGYIWVDEAEKELMKAEVSNAEPIRIGWGIAAGISLLQADYHRKRLPDGRWFVTFFSVRVKVRIFLLKTINRLSESSFSDAVFPEATHGTTQFPHAAGGGSWPSWKQPAAKILLDSEVPREK